MSFNSPGSPPTLYRIPAETKWWLSFTKAGCWDLLLLLHLILFCITCLDPGGIWISISWYRANVKASSLTLTFLLNSQLLFCFQLRTGHFWSIFSGVFISTCRNQDTFLLSLLLISFSLNSITILCLVTRLTVWQTSLTVPLLISCQGLESLCLQHLSSFRLLPRAVSSLPQSFCPVL